MIILFLLFERILKTCTKLLPSYDQNIVSFNQLTFLHLYPWFCTFVGRIFPNSKVRKKETKEDDPIVVNLL